MNNLIKILRKPEILEIIDRLNNINRQVKFNYMRNDENFEFPDNISYVESYRFLESTGLRYMEIFSFMNN